MFFPQKKTRVLITNKYFTEVFWLLIDEQYDKIKWSKHWSVELPVYFLYKYLNTFQNHSLKKNERQIDE